MKKNWRYLLWVFLLAAGLAVGCGREQTPQPPKAQGVETQETEEAQETEETEETEKAQEAEVPQAAETSQETEGIQETKEIQETEGIRETEGTEEIEGTLESGELQETGEQEGVSPGAQVLEDGSYTSKEEVAQYIAIYGHLPDNFITKKEAKALGWVSSEGNLGEVAPGKSIGGDYFGNFEGNLPEKEGREYHECDIDSDGGYRGAKRIVYSNDGLIYYTEDHYETFELLYGEE